MLALTQETIELVTDELEKLDKREKNVCSISLLINLPPLQYDDFILQINWLIENGFQLTGETINRVYEVIEQTVYIEFDPSIYY